MGTLTLRSLELRFGDRVALEGIELDVPSGQIVSVLGPSGSGKSSLLRVVAGLERPSRGTVELDGRDVTDLATHLRGVGLMFQDYALFPHRDVAGNVSFGLRMQGASRRAIQARVAEVLDLVGLPEAGGRAVSTLSGGEQQRVALARALAPRPGLLMLDEPLGSLDRALRERLPPELRAIFESLGVTVLYVTHDQEEASSVADRVVLLRDGRIEADGRPETLWRHPPSAFTARFLGYRNVAAGVRHGDRLETPWGDLAIGGRGSDGPVTVVLRPQALGLAERGAIAGSIVSRRFGGDHVRVTVRVDGRPDDAPPLELELRGGAVPTVGDRVSVAVDPEGIVVLPRSEAITTSRLAPGRDTLER